MATGNKVRRAEAKKMVILGGVVRIGEFVRRRRSEVVFERNG